MHVIRIAPDRSVTFLGFCDDLVEMDRETGRFPGLVRVTRAPRFEPYSVGIAPVVEVAPTIAFRTAPLRWPGGLEEVAIEIRPGDDPRALPGWEPRRPARPSPGCLAGAASVPTGRSAA
ncbi:hypothetical protein ACE7GA_26330 [Roseomonas sp. CCTCC AB2023176]|uniref:hypothetical protein n=1 Tax=Roseomonas sp. CCTCC AB2023176 TaxID=3342640 RepID=UPI0035E0FA82